MPARPSPWRRPRATTRSWPKPSRWSASMTSSPVSGDARSTMSRALELEGAAASDPAAAEPDVPPSVRGDVDGRARCRQIDLRGPGEALPGRGRRGVARGDPVHARRGGVLGRQLVGGRRVRRRELRDHRVDRPPAVPRDGSVREGADRRTPRSSGGCASDRRGRAGARTTIGVGAGESVQPRGVGVPRAVAGQPEGDERPPLAPRRGRAGLGVERARACFGSCRTRSRRSSRSARRTRRVRSSSRSPRKRRRSADPGRSRPPNEAGACSTRRSATSRMRSRRSTGPSSTTRCSTSPSSSAGRSSHRVKRSAA